MARDIEEFLRRAAERRKQQKQGGGAPPPSQRVRQKTRQADVEIVSNEVEIVKADPVPIERKALPSHRESVAEHVEHHINSEAIAQHAEHLGESIQHADDRISQRVQAKFDRDVSKLDDRPTVQDDEVATVTAKDVSEVAQSLMDMLRTPRGVQQAILISEILNRPNFD